MAIWARRSADGCHSTHKKKRKTDHDCQTATAGSHAAREGRADRPRWSAGRRFHPRRRRSRLHADAGRFRRRGRSRSKTRMAATIRASYEHADLGGESAAFLSLNRNKRGIALDFTNPAALRGRARTDRAGGCGGGEFLRRRDEEISASTMPRSRRPTRAWSIARSRPMAARGRLPCVRASIRSRRPKAGSCR